VFRVRGEVHPSDGGPPVPFDRLLPGPESPDGVLTVPASGAVSFTAEPVLPSAASLPPSSGDGRAMLRAAQIALWQSLRLDDVGGYLGNPVGGAAVTRFEFAPAVAGSGRGGGSGPADRPKPVPIAIASALGAALVAAGALTWARN
jgi:hypothetical protein